MTSKHGEKPIVRVAADANVLLSAVAGKAALKVFTQTQVSVVSTALNLEEVWEYLPVMAEKYGLSLELLESQFRLLAVQVCAPKTYHASLAKARKKIASRDPEDADLLALALEFNVPIWSNDSDFDDMGVEWYTTAQLLKKLGF